MSDRKKPRRVRLDLGAAGEDIVTVVEWVKGGRVRVRFDSGAELLMPDHHTRRLTRSETASLFPS